MPITTVLSCLSAEMHRHGEIKLLHALEVWPSGHLGLFIQLEEDAKK